MGNFIPEGLSLSPEHDKLPYPPKHWDPDHAEPLLDPSEQCKFLLLTPQG